jgi:hypothetical protein
MMACRPLRCGQHGASKQIHLRPFCVECCASRRSNAQPIRVFSFSAGGCRVGPYAVLRIGLAGEICFCFFQCSLPGSAGGPSARPVNDADPNSNDVQNKYQ